MAAPSARKTTKRPTAPKTTTAPQKAVQKEERASRSYTVEDDVVHYTTKDGIKLAIDLDFPPDLVQMSMGADDEDRSEEEQFEIIAASYGENFREAYDKMGILERKRLQTAVFTEFAKAMGITMGESSGSSDS
ncbi:hypothetical protein J7E68_01645 [Microbacterium sp. ISL-103]|uniref:hypothetical protein n=1 Tax=Microbacterium sp. ISL-103 TaxID=2819156 RepID=UPI001BEB9BE8|nr:hypothetical protein [Microbacterium sp. ISL-103]MBT2473311.1 hypothetical protein [Microbacterium sp. ISL-103]